MTNILVADQDEYFDAIWACKMQFVNNHQMTLFKIRELKKEFDPEFKNRAAFEYLSDQMADLICDWFYMCNKVEDAFFNSRHIEVGILQLYLNEQTKLISKWQGKLIRSRHMMENKKIKDITDEMIEQARNYPIGNLIEFKRNMANCIFHADNNPSMSLLNGNRVYCHSCKKSWDAISVYQRLNGVSFMQAVRELQ